MNQQQIQEFNRELRECADNFNSSTPNEKVATLIEFYKDDIKPRIVKKDYFGARAKMGLIKYHCQINGFEILAKVHSGLEFCIATDKLFKRLESGTDVDQAVEEFEAYAAQTRLPKERKDNFREVMHTHIKNQGVIYD